MWFGLIIALGFCYLWVAERDNRRFNERHYVLVAKHHLEDFVRAVDAKDQATIEHLADTYRECVE